MNIAIITLVLLIVALSVCITPVNSYNGYGGMYHKRIHLEYDNISHLLGMLKPENHITVLQ